MTNLLLLARVACSRFNLRKPTDLIERMIVAPKRLSPCLHRVYCLPKVITSQDLNRLRESAY